jgi:hypothetical protein
MFNIVCGIRTKNALCSAVEKFRNEPFACWIGFDDDYPECKKDLEEIGFACDEHESGMFAEIEKLSREKKCDDMNFFLFLLFLIFPTENTNAMTWGIENKAHEKFNILFTSDDDVDIIISCDKKSRQSLEEKFRKFFKKVGNEFYYSRLGRDYPKAGDHNENASYFPEDRKLVYKETPMSISIAKLAEIIKTQKVIFYTGAGISARAVPTMDELMKDLGLSQNLKEGRNLQNYVGEIIRNPSHYVEILQKFYGRCENAAPTVAHEELAKIVQRHAHIIDHGKCRSTASKNRIRSHFFCRQR